MGDQSHDIKHAAKNNVAQRSAPNTAHSNQLIGPRPFTQFALPTASPFSFNNPFTAAKTATTPRTNIAAKAGAKAGLNKPAEPAHVKTPANKQYGPFLQPNTLPDLFKPAAALGFSNPQNPFNLKQPETLEQLRKQMTAPSRPKLKADEARKTIATFVQREGSFYELVLRSTLLNAESQHLPFRKQVNTEIAQASTTAQHALKSKTTAATRAEISKQLNELSKQDATTVQQARTYRELAARSSKFVEQMYVPNQGMSALAGYTQCISSINKFVPEDAAKRARLAKAIALLAVDESIGDKTNAAEASTTIAKASDEALAQNKRIDKRLPQNQKRAKELNQVVTALTDHPELAEEFIKTPAAALNATPTMFRADLMLYIDSHAGGVRNGTLTKDKFKTLVSQWNSEHVGVPEKQITFSEREFELAASRRSDGNSINRMEFEEACGMTLPDIDSQGVVIPGTSQPVRTALGDRGFVDFLKLRYKQLASAQSEGMTEGSIKSCIGRWNRDHPTAQVRYDSDSARLFSLWSDVRAAPTDGGSVESVLYQSRLVRADYEVKARERAASDPDAFLKRRVNQELEALRNTVNDVENGRDVTRLENKYDENYFGLLGWEFGHVTNFGLNLWDSVTGSEKGSWKLDSKLSELQTRLANAEAAAAKGDLKEVADTLGIAYKTADKANVMLNDHVNSRDMLARVTRTVVVVTASTTAATLLTPVTAGGSWAVAAPVIGATVTGALVETSLGAMEAKAEGHEYTDFRRDLGMGGLSGFSAGVFAPAGRAIDALSSNVTSQVTTQAANLGVKGTVAQFLPGVTRITANSLFNGTASAGMEGITAATEGDFDHIGERMLSAGEIGAVMTAGTTLAFKGFVAAQDSIQNEIATRRVLNGMSAKPLAQNIIPTTPAAPYISADGTMHGASQAPIIQFNSQSSGMPLGQTNNKFNFNSPAPTTAAAANNPNFYTGPIRFVAGKDLPQQIDRWLEYSGRGKGLIIPAAAAPLTPELALPEVNTGNVNTTTPKPTLNTKTNSSVPAPKPSSNPVNAPVPVNPTPSTPLPNTNLNANELQNLRDGLKDPVRGHIAVKRLLQGGTQGQKVLAEELKLARKVGGRGVDSKVLWEHFMDELPANAKLSPELIDMLRNHKWTVTGSLSPRTLKQINTVLKDSTFIADRAAIPELTKRLGSVRNGDSFRAAAALAELGDDGVKIVLDRIDQRGIFSGTRYLGKRIDALRGLAHADMHALSDATQVRLVKAIDKVSKESVSLFSLRNRFARADAAVAVAGIFEAADPAVKKELVASVTRLLKSNKAGREAINLALTNAAKDSPTMRDAVAEQMVKNLKNGDPNIRKSAYENLGKIGTQHGLTLDEITALERRTHMFRWGLPAELRRSGRKLASNAMNDLTIIPKNGNEFNNKEITKLVSELGDPQLGGAAGKALATQDPAKVVKQLETLLGKNPALRTFGVRDLRRAQIEACATLKQLLKDHDVDDVLSRSLSRRLKEFSGKIGKRNSALKDAAKDVLQTARSTVVTP